MNRDEPSENREDVPKTESLQLEAAPLSLSFPEVFRTNAPFAWRCLRRLGVSQSDADDVCQEVFLVVHRKLPEFDGRASLRAWIYGICVKKASDHRRLAHKKREMLSDQTPDTESLTSGPDASLDSKRALRKLDEVLDSLDDEKRAAFVLYEIEGLSLQDVAASCNCPLQTVYSRLAAARRHVEAALAESRKELR